MRGVFSKWGRDYCYCYLPVLLLVLLLLLLPVLLLPATATCTVTATATAAAAAAAAATNNRSTIPQWTRERHQQFSKQESPEEAIVFNAHV